MIKKFIYLLLIAASPLNMMADDDGFVIRMNNGAADAFKFSETKKITFSGDGLNVIDLNSNVMSTYLFDDIEKIVFESNFTGIDGVVSEGENVQFCLSDDGQKIMLGGVSNGCSMRLYNVTGTMVMNMSRFDGTEIDVSNLPAGIYVLSVNNQTFKFKK